MLGQGPSQAKDVAGEAPPLVDAALYIRGRLLSFFKEDGGHMEIAKKTDVMLPGNFPDVGEGQALVNSHTMCAAACHLTDDSHALPSRPQA